MKMKHALISMLSLLFSLQPLLAADVPYNLQAILITKILGYDYNISKTAQNGTIVIGLLYGEDAKSKNALQGISKELTELRDKGIKVKEYKLEVAPVLISDKLAEELKAKNIGAVYIVNGDAADVAAIAGATQKAGTLSIIGSNVDKCLSNGIAVGLKSDNDRPSIVLNLQSVAKEKHDFSGEFLSVVKIMR